MDEIGRSESLFEHFGTRRVLESMPLASRMRPVRLEDFVGQTHLVGEGRMLARAIEGDVLPSMVLWGPPGVGKTTLAHVIAQTTRSKFWPVSAVISGVSDVRKILANAREERTLYGSRTILFVDEVHRFNKAQQEIILPHVENGDVTFIGATTENPSFGVVAPLLSRCRVLNMVPLTTDEIIRIVIRALGDKELGIGNIGLQVDQEGLEFLAEMSSGDARFALNTLEILSHMDVNVLGGNRSASRSEIEEAIQKRSLAHDKNGNNHYDLISAYIKSMRVSDADAAIYWLVRMVEAGEDPLFIARRIVIFAAEDVGMADPQALSLAVATQQAVAFVGLPEGAIPLAEATIYLAGAKKNKSAYEALNRARDEVRNGYQHPVPFHLLNNTWLRAKEPDEAENSEGGNGKTLSASDDSNLPEALKGTKFYKPME